MRSKAHSRFYKSVIFLLVLFSCTDLLHSQSQGKTDSLSVNIGTGVILSSRESFLPHYLVFNRNGAIDESHSVFIEGDLSYKRSFLTDGKIDFGLSFRNDRFISHFARATYKGIALSIGRRIRRVGGPDPSLTTGSLSFSNNAEPIPQILFEIPDFKKVPWTQGYLSVKGFISHGWLEEDRAIRNPWLHSKALYLQLDLSKEIGFRPFSGLIHNVVFGGTLNGEKLPSGFRDYLRLMVGGGIPNPDGTSEGESNAIGNHLGVFDSGFELDTQVGMITMNYQVPYDDQGGLQYFEIRDFLLGLTWEPKKTTWFKKIYIEYLNTVWQNGTGIPDPIGNIQTVEDNRGNTFGGRDDYYNNWLYRSGWTYKSMVIGNPLFLTFARTLNFFSIYPMYDVDIANNRFQSFHIGIEGDLGSNFNYRSLMTYTNNRGTYAGINGGRFQWEGAATDPNFEYPFLEHPKQFYSLFELNWSCFLGDKNLTASTMLAIDLGQLYSNVGIELGLNYRIK